VSAITVIFIAKKEGKIIVKGEKIAHFSYVEKRQTFSKIVLKQGIVNSNTTERFLANKQV
jgi:hypothetical protein